VTFVSHAQNFEDVVLWRALHDVDGGRYLDIGAQDPIADSVSFGFYELGWRGIHVEATPHYATRLREARPDEVVIEAAVTDAPGPIEFYELIETGLSTGRADIAQEHERAGYAQRKLLVPCVRLDHILDMAPGDIHWMKIDVEGMEGDVLRSWGDSPARPWILVIEATYPNSQKPTHSEWLDLVLGRGYREVFYDGLSRYFVHESRKERAAAFDAPANVFDGFAISRLHFSARPLRAEIEQAEQHVIEEQARAASLESQLADTGHKLLEEQSRVPALESVIADARQKLDAEQSRASDLQSQLADTQALVVTEQGRVSDLRSQLSEAQGLIAAAREAEISALDRLARAEREHNGALEVMWRQREAAAQELRAEFAEKEASLRAAFEHIRLTEAAARVDLARFEERAAHLETALSRAQEEQHRIRSEAEQARVEHARLIGDRDAALERSHASVRRADELIEAARAQPLSAWLRLGNLLRLWRLPSTYEALFEWSGTAAQTADFPDLTQSNQVQVQQSMVSPASLDNRNPFLRANSLRELIAWEDIDFVRCAYVTVLGRQPDPAGERYYVDRLRGGEAKLQILFQLRSSPEARRHDPGIAGFDRSLRRFRRARLPVLGSIFARDYRREWVPGAQNLRRIENALWRNHNLEANLLNSIAHKVGGDPPASLPQARAKSPLPVAVGEVLTPADKLVGLGRDDLLSFFSQSAIRNIRHKLSA
jgi:FkbM family methyltransferase